MAKRFMVEKTGLFGELTYKLLPAQFRGEPVSKELEESLEKIKAKSLSHATVKILSKNLIKKHLQQLPEKKQELLLIIVKKQMKILLEIIH